MRSITHLPTLLLALACAAAMPAVQAQQAFPSRPIRIIVPSAAGSSTVDHLPRLIAQKLTERLGWNVVVENKPGGNFTIGAQEVLRAPADGHTILAAASSLALLPTTMPTLPFDLRKDFIPVTRTAALQLVLISGNAQPFKTFPEFVVYAKSHPNALSYASAGSKTVTHFAGEMLRQHAGIDIVNVPYKDGGFVAEVMAGNVQLGITTVSSVSAQVRAAQVKALAILGPKRSLALPDVPTTAELGLSSVIADAWLGFMVKAGTPDAVVQQLNKEVIAILRLPEVRERMVGYGATSEADTPGEFRAVLERDIDAWARVVKQGGITVD